MSNDTPNFRGHFPLDGRLRKRNRKVQKWRYPRGIDRHMSVKKGPQPKIGYGHKSTEKGLHPCGMKECIVRTVDDINKLNPKEVAIRFNRTLGLKKRTELKKVAKEKGFKILN